ncbi:translation protein SH3-like domain-containing protein [Paraphysoderma sedebokerense]|nr:translation protein SH3-like domain-containing protein [Paraphysoderma sedebokerense]
MMSCRIPNNVIPYFTKRIRHAQNFQLSSPHHRQISLYSRLSSSSSSGTSKSAFTRSSFLSSLTRQPVINFLSRRYVHPKVVKRDGKFVTYKPVTPALRHRRDIDLEALDVYTGPPIYELTIVKKRSGGRNAHGRITVRGRGGGPRRRIRIVDFYRNKKGPHEVVRIEHDPFRSGFLALLKHQGTGELSYIVAPHQVKAGDVIQSFRQGIPSELLNVEPGTSTSSLYERGNCLQLRHIPVGTLIHNIAIRPWGPAQLCRSAGTYAQVIQTGDSGYAQIRLQSGEVRLIHVACVATIGMVSNLDWQHRVLGSAGRKRNLMGRRPKVRGVAMNPVDHPHGGGEGKTKGKHPVTPWGVPTKGFKTRKKSKPTWWIVKDRRRVK